jgi:integrase
MRLANDLLRSLKRIFDYGVTSHYLSYSPASAFRSQDAGGKALSRERALSFKEAAIKNAPHFAKENEIAVRLLLLLGVRKMELLAASWDEFDLDAGEWNIPALRSRNERAVRVPLSATAVELFQARRIPARRRASGLGAVRLARRRKTAGAPTYGLPNKPPATCGR